MEKPKPKSVPKIFRKDKSQIGKNYTGKLKPLLDERDLYRTTRIRHYKRSGPSSSLSMDPLNVLYHHHLTHTILYSMFANAFCNSDFFASLLSIRILLMGQRLMSLKLGTFLDFIVCSSDGVGDDWCFYGGVFNRLFRSTVSLQLVSIWF